MNKNELESYRVDLLMRFDQLQKDGETTATDREPVVLDQQSVGRLSRMDALQQQAMAKATQARRAAESARITAALKRIEIGEFGYCLKCGADIARKRLDFEPTAPTCIECAHG